MSSPDLPKSPESRPDEGSDDLSREDSDQFAKTSDLATNGSPQDDGSKGKSWMTLAGLGMELATSTLVLAGAGHLVDRYRGKPDGFGVAIGAFLGFGLGMFRFIQKALQQIEKS